MEKKLEFPQQIPYAHRMRRPSLSGLVLADSWLAPYAGAIDARLRLFDSQLAQLKRRFGSLRKAARLHEKMGIHRDAKTGEWVYREWAPGARGLYLVGDFNGWNRESHPLQRLEGGVWSLRLPADTLAHGSRVKVHVHGSDNSRMDRIPAWIRYTVQDPNSFDYCGVVWAPEAPYEWKNRHKFRLGSIKTPYIYECHIGMAGEEGRVHQYREFADHILPRIAKAGYNTVQIMAVQEHPYYGSFGYHVSSFFAPSSRFGSPEDLKYLIDTAHGMGIAVLLDIVHSHAVKNMAEGLNNFDGSGGQYFNAGARDSMHPDWDSCLFNYGKPEVQSFLLSNLDWWLNEFDFDGFRFDGVTSMLYIHHGHEPFGDLSAYFNEQVNLDAVTYLQLATTLIADIKPDAFIIAEDMSGMPGLCRPVAEGGCGFTQRLAMGLPDYWIKLIKERKDEEWSVGNIWHTLTNRRYGEANIAYAESHDQALVGDKTLAFRLMDAKMYTNMDIHSQDLEIDRGMALHKMIRLATLAAGGEGWLNFMGNEFGHPEWIDFPREGNDNSYQYCRRQWSLADNDQLRYRFLGNFDRAMLQLAQRARLLESRPAQPVHMDEGNQIMAFERGSLIFIFNWSGDRAISDYSMALPQAGSWRIVLDSDAADFGGFARLDAEQRFFSNEMGQLSLYLLPRSCMVLQRA